MSDVRWEKLQAEISQHILRQRLLNKKLARDVAKWVEDALSISECVKNTDNSTFEDIQVADDALT